MLMHRRFCRPVLSFKYVRLAARRVAEEKRALHVRARAVGTQEGDVFAAGGPKGGGADGGGSGRGYTVEDERQGRVRGVQDLGCDGGVTLGCNRWLAFGREDALGDEEGGEAERLLGDGEWGLT